VKVHEKHITVVEEDLDDLNHVNNVRYVQWVQDIAKEHWEKEATSAVLSEYFWVMINHFIEYKGEARLGDVVILKTYVIRSEGVTSTRVVEMFLQGKEKPIVRSETNWCFMSFQSKRPARITEEVISLFD